MLLTDSLPKNGHAAREPAAHDRTRWACSFPHNSGVHYNDRAVGVPTHRIHLNKQQKILHRFKNQIIPEDHPKRVVADVAMATHTDPVSLGSRCHHAGSGQAINYSKTQHTHIMCNCYVDSSCCSSFALVTVVLFSKSISFLHESAQYVFLTSTLTLSVRVRACQRWSLVPVQTCQSSICRANFLVILFVLTVDVSVLILVLVFVSCQHLFVGLGQFCCPRSLFVARRCWSCPRPAEEDDDSPMMMSSLPTTLSQKPKLHTKTNTNTNTKSNNARFQKGNLPGATGLPAPRRWRRIPRKDAAWFFNPKWHSAAAEQPPSPRKRQTTLLDVCAGYTYM